MVMEVMISKLSKKIHKTLALIKLPGNRGLKQGSHHRPWAELFKAGLR